LAAVTSLLGTGTSIWGQIESGRAQMSAERANAAFYAEQSEFARRSMMREYELYNDQAAEYTGEVISQAGKGGAVLSGSPLLYLGTVFARQEAERTAILEDGNFKVREANLRRESSLKSAKNINDAMTISVISTGVGGYADFASSGMASGAKSGGSTKKQKRGWMD